MNKLDAQPSSEDAEKMIIGGIMLEPESIERIIPWLSNPEAFWYKKNRLAWIALNEMYKKKIFIDMTTVANYCKDNYPEISVLHIASCANAIASTSHIHEYAKIIQEKYLQRRLDSSLRTLTTKNLEKYDENVLQDHLAIINNLQNLQPRKDVSIEDLIDKTLDHIKTSDNLIPFGHPKLDSLAGGMTRKEITVIGGRPSHGKSTLCMNILKGLIDQDLKVVMFNREMNNIEMLKKLMTIETNGASYTNIRRQTLSEPEAIALGDTSQYMKERYKNFHVYDNIKTVDEAMREIRFHKPDVIIDDYIQKIMVSGGKDRRFQLEDIMNEYSWISKEINAATILVSQLNRDIEKRLTDPRPRMSDFAESGAIEQVAEAALFTFRGFVFDHQKYNKYELEIIAAKVRYGNPATHKMGFNGNRCKIYENKEEAMIGV